MLIADPKQFTMDLSGAESQLYLSGIFIRFERQRVFDITLWFECRWYSGCHTSWTSPSWVTLTSSFSEASYASTVFPATEGGFLVVADFLGLRAASYAVSR